MVQLSHSYMTTGKTIALTILTFVGKGFVQVPQLNPFEICSFVQVPQLYPFENPDSQTERQTVKYREIIHLPKVLGYLTFPVKIKLQYATNINYLI